MLRSAVHCAQESAIDVDDGQHHEQVLCYPSLPRTHARTSAAQRSAPPSPPPLPPFLSSYTRGSTTLQ